LGVAQRAVTLAKVATALSGALTVSCAVTLAALQVAAGLTDGVWGAPSPVLDCGEPEKR
jgi:hypothetical protein